MKALWSLFWSVCQMRRGPEDMPFSLPLLLFMLGLNMALGIGIQFATGPAATAAAIGIVLLAVAVDALVLWLLLAFKGLQMRFVQSLIAVYGADFLLGLFALPLVALGLLAGRSPLLAAVVFGQMLLVGWNLGVRGFIYHRALHIGIFQANMLSLTLFLLHIFIAVRLFPELVASSGSP